MDASELGITTRMADLTRSTLAENILKDQKIEYPKCIESIQFSSFNPVPVHRKQQGDLFYLTVKALDVGERGITCCVNGFYVNNSAESSTFNPTPSTRKTAQGKSNPAYSYTLIGCLNQISPQFGKNLERYVNEILKTEQTILLNPATPVQNWIVFQDRQAAETASSQDELGDFLNPLNGIDPKGTRDWNEEYQVVKDFQKDHIMQRAQRDRAMTKIYNDFCEAATKGATAIIKGNIQPINPNEDQHVQVYVFNSIFFSHLIDQIDNFKDSATVDSTPSWTQGNHDITGLRSLQFSEIDGLYYIATVIIQYRGQRLLAQSIIPGILNNTDMASLAEYGTVDEQKTINFSQPFHELVSQFCEKMFIDTCKVEDKSGNQVEIAGSVEIKGIRGTDKRAYLVDLQGIIPRDANYLGDENHTCLVRQELTILYQRHLASEFAKEKMVEYEESINKECSENIKSIIDGKEDKDLTDE